MTKDLYRIKGSFVSLHKGFINQLMYQFQKKLALMVHVQYNFMSINKINQK